MFNDLRRPPLLRERRVECGVSGQSKPYQRSKVQLSTLHKAQDAGEEANRPQACCWRSFLLGQEQQFGVMLEFLVAAGTRVCIEEVAEFKPAARTSSAIHIGLYFAERGVWAICSGNPDLDFSLFHNFVSRGGMIRSRH